MNYNMTIANALIESFTKNALANGELRGTHQVSPLATWELERTKAGGWNVRVNSAICSGKTYTTPTRTLKADGEINIERLAYDVSKVVETALFGTDNSRTVAV